MSAEPKSLDAIFQLRLGTCPFYLQMVREDRPALYERLMGDFLGRGAGAGRISGPEMNWIFVRTSSEGTQVYSAKGVDMDAAERLATRAIRATPAQTVEMMIASYEPRPPFARRLMDGAELGRRVALVEHLNRMKAEGLIGGYSLL